MISFFLIYFRSIAKVKIFESSMIHARLTGGRTGSGVHIAVHTRFLIGFRKV